MDKNQLAQWLVLLRAPQIGYSTFHQILKHYPDLEQLFSSKRSDFAELNLPQETIEYLCKPDWQIIEPDLQWEQNHPNHHIITFKEPTYPELLKKISHPPPILYVKGDLDCINQPQIAMVGTRKPSPEAKEIATQLSFELSQAGLLVTSGLAQGIDTAAHQGALRHGSTLAVIGTGIDQYYPKCNYHLAKQIEQQGAIISEFPLHTLPYAANFPRRNRIISGISLGTVVIEAALKSGSLITARNAVEEGREVFAIPGSIRNPKTKGCHYLIQQGAKLIEKVEDILEEVGFFSHNVLNKTTNTKPLAQKTLDDDHIKLLECIGYEATKIDILVSRSNFSIQTVTSILIDLELAGYLLFTADGYIRVS